MEHKVESLLLTSEKSLIGSYRVSVIRSLRRPTSPFKVRLLNKDTLS